MFLDVKELASPSETSKSYAPGKIDFHTAE